MSSLLNGVRQFQYIGAPQAVPTALCTPPTQKPMNIPITIDWNIYFTVAGNAPSTLGVAVDLSGNSPNVSKLDAIRSVKIDNTASYCTIYVWFTDTDDVVTCAPQTVTTMPVNTNQQKFVVIASGLRTGFLPRTNVYIYNVQLPPSVDPAIQIVYPQWIGSPSIQLNANQILTPGFGAPALGDQTRQYTCPIWNHDNTIIQNNVFDAPYTSGFIYLTGISIGLVARTTVGTYRLMTVQLRSTGVSGVLYTWYMMASASAPGWGVMQVFSQTGLNIKLSATETWQLFCIQSALQVTSETQFVAVFHFSKNDL